MNPSTLVAMNTEAFNTKSSGRGSGNDTCCLSHDSSRGGSPAWARSARRAAQAVGADPDGRWFRMRSSAEVRRTDDAPRMRANEGRALSSRVQESRSEEHTSELQSHLNLVCRLLLEKKKRTD